MNKGNALIDIIRDVQSDRLSPTSYKRVCRALKALGLDATDQQLVLVHLCYHSPQHPTEPYARYVKAVRS